MPWWIGIIVLALVVLVVGIFAVMLLRASPRGNTHNTLNPTFELDAESATHAADSLSMAVRFRTVSKADAAENEYSEWVKFRDYLRKRYPNVHNTLVREVVGDYSLLYRWAAPEPTGDAILLCGHLDVVEALGEWEYPPFAGASHDGYIWGRGTLDCKNVVICLLEAVESLLIRGVTPSQDVYLAFGHDHETGGKQGAAAIARLFAEREVKFTMVLDEGGWLSRGTLPLRQPVAQVATAEKGRMDIKLTVKARGGQVSTPPRHTAVGILAEAIARIEYKPCRAILTPLVRTQLVKICSQLPFRWRFALANLPLTTKQVIKLCTKDEKLNSLVRTTFAVTQLSADYVYNALPQTTEAYLNVRLLHGDTSREMLQFVTDLVADLGVEVEALECIEPSEVSAHTTLQFQRIQQCIKDVFGTIQVVPALLTGNSDTRWYEQYSKQIFRFSPFALTPLDQNRLHAVDEGVRTDALGLAVSFYRELILAMATKA